MLKIYKASAGSGKTFTLTREYIKMLLGVKDDNGKYKLIENRDKAQRHILAITFTNKATEEMKQRIIYELSILASDPVHCKLINYLKDDLQTNDLDKIKNAAKNALYSILFNFSSFNISTIDSFFQQILRTFAFDIDRNGSFEIELDRRAIISQVIIQLFESLDASLEIVDTQTQLLRHWLEVFMEDQVEDSKKFNIFNRDSSLFSMLVEDINSLINEEFILRGDEMMPYLEHPEKLKAFEKALSRYISEIKNEIKVKAEKFLNEINALEIAGFSKMKPEWLNKWITGQIDDPNTTTLKAAEDEDKVFSKSAKDIGKAPDVSLSLKQEGKDLAQTVIRNYSMLKTANIMKKNICLTGLLSIVVKAMREYCRERNIIMLSDTNELINGIIDGSPTPFIYERMGLKLNNYLIDEFQDTSKMQWQNMMPLLVESLSKGYDDLIIGDEKQSIYRFRNAEPELLGSEAQKDIESQDQPVEVRGNKLSENVNWRSSENVIRFNNSLFFALGNALNNTSELGENNAYKKVIQDIPPKNDSEPGKVTFRFLESKNNSEFSEEATQLAIETISELLKVYKPGDIAILIRKNEEGQTITEALLNAMKSEPGIEPKLPKFKIISNEAVALNSSPAIKLLVNILKLNSRLDNMQADESAPAKKYSQADSLKLHHRFELNLTSTKIDDYDDKRKEILGDALIKAVEDSNITSEIYRLNPLKNSVNDLLSLIDRAILLLPEDMRAENTLFITMFQDVAKDYLSRNQGDLYSFLKWWDLNGYIFKVDSPESKDAMTISTIHKSKGLEFKCVIIPYAGKKPKMSDEKLYWVDSVPLKGIPDEIIPPIFPTKLSKSLLAGTPFENSYNLRSSKQLVDVINTYYVAFTRAKQELYVIAMKDGEKEMKSIYDTMCSLTRETLSSYMDREHLDKSIDRLVAPLADYIDVDNGSFEYGISCKPTFKDDSSTKRNSIEMPSYKVFDNSKMLFLVTTEKENIDPEDARNMGTFMHEVLKGVYSKDDILFRCRQEGQKAGLDSELVDERIAILTKAVSDERVSAWFEDFDRVVMERNIASQESNHTRPDRIVWTKNGTVDIIDYK
ncbi:MAG: UvrD-helicase domain-containing protein, partial [Muribaculaceae bacterium]|nr:UvrD-helicase domain-containing protein [Muribaculaceae bacterium]